MLEVGCGRGELAAALLALGCEVTALDRDPRAVAAARERGVPAREADFLGFAGGPFDAVVLSRSLHELADVEAGLDRVERALAPGGVVVVDEFGRDLADRPTASLFFDACALLEAAGVLSPPPFAPDDDPLRRWRRQYGDLRERPLPGAAELRDRVAARFEVAAEERLPYLYRQIGQWLPDGERGTAVARRLRDVEVARIGRGELAPIGMRLVARRRPAG